MVNYSLGFYNEALKDINFFIDNRDTVGNLAEAYLNKASVLLKLNDKINSKRFYELAISENGKKVKAIEAKSLVGMVNFAKSHNEALQLLDAAISFDDSCYFAYTMRANIYLSLGKINEAYEDYKKAIFYSPRDPDANFNLGQLFANYLNNKDSAIHYFENAIYFSPQAPNNDVIYMNMGVLKHRSGDTQNALNDFKEGENLNPKNDLLLYNYAMLLSDLGQNSEAMDKINNAISINSKDADYFNFKGTLYLDKSLFNEAEKEFQKAIRLNPGLGIAYYNLGYLFSEQNKHAQSIEFYETAVRLNYDLESTLVNLALEKIQINNIVSACKDLKRAFSLGRTDIAPLLNKYCN